MPGAGNVFGTKLKTRDETESRCMFLAMLRRGRRAGGTWRGKKETRDMGGLRLGVRRFVLSR
jgi:hypothetical protein